MIHQIPPRADQEEYELPRRAIHRNPVFPKKPGFLPRCTDSLPTVMPRTVKSHRLRARGLAARTHARNCRSEVSLNRRYPIQAVCSIGNASQGFSASLSGMQFFPNQPRASDELPVEQQPSAWTHRQPAGWRGLSFRGPVKCWSGRRWRLHPATRPSWEHARG